MLNESKWRNDLINFFMIHKNQIKWGDWGELVYHRTIWGVNLDHVVTFVVLYLTIGHFIKKKKVQFSTYHSKSLNFIIYYTFWSIHIFSEQIDHHIFIFVTNNGVPTWNECIRCVQILQEIFQICHSTFDYGLK